MSAIVTLTTGDDVITTKEVTEIPRYLFYVAGTQLDAISLSINQQGKLVDLTTKGLNSFGVLGNDGQVTDGYMIPLGDGVVNKVGTFTFQNSAAQTPTIYGFGNQPGSAFVKYTQQAALAGTPITLANFLALAAPDAAAADTFQITFANGYTETWLRNELQAFLSINQAIQNGAADYVLSNTGRQKIAQVKFTGASAQTLFASEIVGIDERF